MQNLRPSNVKVIFQRPSCGYPYSGGFRFHCRYCPCGCDTQTHTHTMLQLRQTNSKLHLCNACMRCGIKIELNKKFQSCEIFSNKPINYSLETAATKRTGEFESICNFQQKTNLITRRKLQPQNVPVTSESRALAAATSRRSAKIVSLCSCTCLLSSTLSR